MKIPTENFKSRIALSLFALTCIVGVAADLFTKHYAFARLAPHERGAMDTRPRVIEFIPGWLHFEITVNHGAVFGVGQGRKPLFLAVSLLALVALIYLFATSKRQRFYQFILGMLLAGVLGNAYDRVVFGHVRDMIHALPGWTWPGTWKAPLLNYPGDDRAVFPFIFNVADILLCVGVGLMIVYSLFVSPEKEQGPDRAKGPGSEPAPVT